MLCSLIHTETGSSSQYKLFSFEPNRLLQSLFGYHYLTSSLMEEAVRPTKQSPTRRGGDCFAWGCISTHARKDIKGFSLREIIEFFQWTHI